MDLNSNRKSKLPGLALLHGYLNTWKKLGALPREIWILSLSTLVNRAGTMVMPFLVLYLTRSLGFELQKAASILFVYGLVALAIGPLSGAICDRLGPIPILKTSLLLSGSTLLIFPLARTYPAVLALTFVFAVFTESFRPAGMVLIADYAPADLRAQSFALNRLAVNLGMSIGPVIGGILAEKSFHSLFLIDGLTTLASLLVLSIPAFALRSKPREATPASGLLEPLRAMWECAADRGLMRFLFAMIPVAMVFFQSESTMPVYLVRDLHFRESLFGMLSAINTVLILLFEVPLNGWMSHWPHRRSLALGCLLFGLGFGALGWTHTPGAVALSIVIWTLGEMILFPTLSATVSELAPENKRGAYMGLFSATFGIAFTVAPWIGTTLLEQAGARTLWICMLGFAVASGAMMLSLPEAGARTSR